MSENALLNNWGSIYRIPVLIGQNLNLLQVRGFARMDFLADVSGADVFDQVSNPEGTQRELKRAHAKEAYEYAVGSLDSDPFEDARAFTEVILNARQTEAVELIVEGKEINFSELELELGQTLSAELVFHLGKVRYPSIDEPLVHHLRAGHTCQALRKALLSERNSLFTNGPEYTVEVLLSDFFLFDPCGYNGACKHAQCIVTC